MYSTITGEPRAIAVQSIVSARCPWVMPGDEGRGRCDVAMRQRDAGIGEAAEPGGDAGHDAERDPRLGQASASSPPRPNTQGSPPLRRSTAAPLARQLDQPGRDVGLARRRPAAALAGG